LTAGNGEDPARLAVRGASVRAVNTLWHVKRCFVAAPPGSLAVVRPLLEEAGLEAVVPTDLPQAGSTVSEAITQAVGSADVVLGVLGETSPRSNVLFELGMAVGLGRPTIILADPGAAIPSDLADTLVLRWAPDVGESLRFAVEQLTGEPHEQPAASEQERPLGHKAQRWLAMVPPKALPDHDALMRSVIDALASTGIRTLEGPAHDRHDFDLALWSPNLRWLDANPLPVEIKQDIRGGDEARLIGELLQRRLALTPARWALLLYGSGPEGRSLEPALRAFAVLVMRVDELFEQLEADPFPEVIRRLRNERVHGGGHV
jgi:hypothetical protein